jgi:AcrR family transcriptional regulator
VTDVAPRHAVGAGAGDPGPVPRGPGRPRDAGRDRAILKATLGLLLEVGYRDLTIERVATTAGVGRPTIYRRWPSKAALVVAALAESNRIAIPSVDTGSVREDLLDIQRHQTTLMSVPTSRRVTAGLVADLAADPELAEKYLVEYLAPRREAVFEVLRRGVERGELVPDVDYAFVYDLLLGPLFLRTVVWGQPLPPESAERTVDVIMAAFGADGPGARPSPRPRGR